NLVLASLPTTVWDRSKKATESLAAAGARLAAAAPDAVHDARVVITMLPTADAVESVGFDGGGAAAFAGGGVGGPGGPIGRGGGGRLQRGADRARAGRAVRGRAGFG